MAGRIIVDHDPERPQHAHHARRPPVQIGSQTMFEQGNVHRAIDLRDADGGAEITEGLGGVAAAAQAGNRRHPRIVPAANQPVLDQLQQEPLAHHRVGQIEPGELDLLRGENAQLADVPVVKRPMVLELQRANRMGDPFDRIGLAVRKVVGRINAPRVARAMMGRPKNAIHDRVAHVQVRRGHVDLRPKGFRAVGKLAGLHPLEQIEIFLNRAVAKWAVRARRGQRAAGFADFVGVKSQTYALPAPISCTAHW